MRCKACDKSMENSPIFYKDEDGELHFNDLCSSCTTASNFADYYYAKMEPDFIFLGIFNNPRTLAARIE